MIKTSAQTSVPLDKGVLGPDLRKLMSTIVEYSKNLSAIAAAGNADEVKTAVEATKGAAIGLAGAIDAPNPSQKLAPGVTNWATPVASLLNYGLQRQLEALKLQALREATQDTDSIFQSIAIALGEAADTGFLVVEGQAYGAYVSALRAYNDERNKEKPQALRERLLVLREKAATLDAVLKSNPKESFQALAEAHSKLTFALQQPNPDFGSLWQQLQRVSDEAGKIGELAKQFKVAAAKR